MKTMPLPNVNTVLRVDEGFMDPDRPPDFFLTAPNGDCWYVSGNDLQYLESRTKLNKAFLGVENRVRKVFEKGVISEN